MLHFVCLNSGHEKLVSVGGLLELVPQQDSKYASVDFSAEGLTLLQQVQS